MERKKLPDSPWHIGYTKKKENDPRRHKARCIYYDNKTKICISAKSSYCGVKCGGSAHCGAYRETPEQPIKQISPPIKGIYSSGKKGKINASSRNEEKRFIAFNDIVTIRNLKTGEEKRYRIISGMGKKPPEITSICLGKQNGYCFSWKNENYIIIKISTI